MKQSNIFQFFGRDNSTSNSNESNIKEKGSKTTRTNALKHRNILALDNHAKDEQDKENQMRISMKDKQSIGIRSVTTKLTPAQVSCSNPAEHGGSSSSSSIPRTTSKEISADQNNSDNEEEIQMVYDQELNAEQKERKLMEDNGVYSNAAVCVTSFDLLDITKIRELEAIEFEIALDGGKKAEQLYGGSQNSDELATKRRIRKRLRRASFSDIEEFEQCSKPQTEDNQWIVEKVLAKRNIIQDGQRAVQYYLKWKGWDYPASTWEFHSEDNAINRLIRHYDRRQNWRQIILRKVPAAQRENYHEAYMNKSFLDCHEWEDEMNKLLKENTKQAPIYVENWVDQAGRPEKFKFIVKNRFSKEVEKKCEGVQGVEHCKCAAEGEPCGATQNCCPDIMNQVYCYLDECVDVRKLGNNWVVECTDACSCDITCPTRVAQRGRKFPLVIFRTLDRGWSLRTCVDIQKNAFVCEYLGEVLTTDEAFAPDERQSNADSTYQYQMDFGNKDNFKFVVDAKKYGNEARFINHSCDPNLIVRPVFADRLDILYKRLAFFAVKEISAGTELTIDYLAIDQNATKKRKKKCRCNSRKCRKFFYY